jgi:hypothetical protein
MHVTDAIWCLCFVLTKRLYDEINSTRASEERGKHGSQARQNACHQRSFTPTRCYGSNFQSSSSSSTRHNRHPRILTFRQSKVAVNLNSYICFNLPSSQLPLLAPTTF